MDNDIKVAMIYVSGTLGTALLTFLGIFIQKNYICGCCSREKPVPEPLPIPLPEPNPYLPNPEPLPLSNPVLPVPIPDECQILETKLGNFLGIIKVNQSNCFTNKKKCPFCNKYFCEYHIKPNNTGDTGGHVCESINP